MCCVCFSPRYSSSSRRHCRIHSILHVNHIFRFYERHSRKQEAGKKLWVFFFIIGPCDSRKSDTCEHNHLLDENAWAVTVVQVLLIDASNSSQLANQTRFFALVHVIIMLMLCTTTLNYLSKYLEHKFSLLLCFIQFFFDRT